MKLKGLLNGSATETVFKADDKLEVVQLERKECTYSYFSDPLYVFMDTEYNQYDVEKDNLGDALNYLVDGMEDLCEVTFYNEKAISVELPTTIVREVEYTEPAARGDTSGKVTKPARLKGTSYELAVAAFVRSATRSKSIPAPVSSSVASTKLTLEPIAKASLRLAFYWPGPDPAGDRRHAYRAMAPSQASPSEMAAAN